MAKVKYTSALDDSLGSLFSGAMTFNKHSKTLTAYTEVDSGDTIVFSGSGFTYANGEFTGGTITKVTFTNAAGDNYAVVTDLHLKASQLPDIKPAGMHAALIETLYKGNDVIHASNAGNGLWGGDGNDNLIGGDGDDRFEDSAGNDRYTGGKGVDIFDFIIFSGKEVITDFDGTGGDGKHDLIFTQYEFELRKSGDDVIVDFIDTPGTIRLLDVKLSVVEDDIIWV